MKYIMKSVFFMALLALSIFGLAQATLPSTTISAAIARGDNPIPLASVTNVTVGGYIYIDREAMRVNSVNTTTLLVSVTRGDLGTRASAHISGATAYVGPPNYFAAKDQSGSCTSTNEVVSPIINVLTGVQYNCVNGQWESYDSMARFQATFTGGAATGSADIFPFADTASNTGTGNVVSITTATGSLAKPLTVTGGAASSAASPATPATAVTITGAGGGAQSATTGSGGNAGPILTVTGAAGGAGGSSSGTGGTGGAISETAGPGGGTITGGTGGAASLTAGAGGSGSTTAGNGGVASLAGGAAVTTAGTAGVGGAANVVGGVGSPNTGSGGTGGAGGTTSVTGGAGGAASTGAATGGAGGAATLAGGAGGGTITGGAGGSANVTGGNGANGSTAGGAGGAVNVTAGNAGTGGTPAGGNIVLVPGVPTSTGATGKVLIAGATAGSHLSSSQTTAPVPTGSCTTPAIAAGSTDMKGTASAASCTAAQTVILTFNKPYASTPVCVISPSASGAAVTASAQPVAWGVASTTALTITSPTVSTTSPAWNYICVE